MPQTEKTRARVLEMFSLAIADGFVAPEELAVIYEKGEQLGLNHMHISEVIQDPYSVEFVEPEDITEAIGRLYDLGVVLLSDGIIDHRELSLIRSFAIRLGIEEHLVEPVLTALLDELKANTSRDDLLKKLRTELGR
jgi:hypothetical protein